MSEQRQIEKNRATLKEMVTRKENAVCADCGRRRPRWASINLGVFICDTCAGVHRGIGVHITQVRSIDLDDWKNDWVKVMENMGGNIKANELYEAKNKNPVKTEVTNETFIRDKYVNKKWMGKPKKAAKKESSDSESDEKPKPKPKKEVESEKPKKKTASKKAQAESEDSDSEAEVKPKSRTSKKTEETAKKQQDFGFDVPSSGSKSSKPTTKQPAATASSWDPFAGGVAQVQEQAPAADDWGAFTTSKAAAPAPVVQPQATPGGWAAFDTDHVTAGVQGLQVSAPQQQQQQQQQAAAVPAKPAGPSKTDILSLFDQPSHSQSMGMGMGPMGGMGGGMGMGMGMGGMGAMGGMQGMGMGGMGGMQGMGMGGGMQMGGMGMQMGGGMGHMGGGLQQQQGMGLMGGAGGMGGMMRVMSPQEQQQYMISQRMNPMQQQQFMQQQYLLQQQQQQQMFAAFSSPPQQQKTSNTNSFF